MNPLLKYIFTDVSECVDHSRVSRVDNCNTVEQDDYYNQCRDDQRYGFFGDVHCLFFVDDNCHDEYVLSNNKIAGQRNPFFPALRNE